ncbi:uncharacterized protein LOC141580081 [Saimiri boliviensis]|uniref:uncharacterized protein LOC141580081 n=1 Tax=Saimiri boliviensis TaxID=27679 RepID=UPI003D787AFB
MGERGSVASAGLPFLTESASPPLPQPQPTAAPARFPWASKEQESDGKLRGSRPAVTGEEDWTRSPAPHFAGEQDWTRSPAPHFAGEQDWTRSPAPHFAGERDWTESRKGPSPGLRCSGTVLASSESFGPRLHSGLRAWDRLASRERAVLILPGCRFLREAEGAWRLTHVIEGALGSPRSATKIILLNNSLQKSDVEIGIFNSTKCIRIINVQDFALGQDRRL